MTRTIPILALLLLSSCAALRHPLQAAGILGVGVYCGVIVGGQKCADELFAAPKPPKLHHCPSDPPGTKDCG